MVLDDFGMEGGPGVGWLVHGLARPAHRDDRLAYVASQYVAENLKALGVDGIIYRSSFNPILGRNLALFDPAAAAPVGTELHEVMTVSITSRERLLGK